MTDHPSSYGEDEDDYVPDPPQPEINWGFPEVLPDTIEYFELQEKKLFLEKLMQGYGVDVAARSIGWSPAQQKRVLKDPDMIELMSYVKDHMNQNVVRALYVAAITGNVTAAQFWVLNRMPDEWRDTKRIVVERDERISIEVVHSVKQSALELLRSHGVQALQPGGALDVIDVESSEGN